MSHDHPISGPLLTAASFLGAAGFCLSSAAADLPVKHVDVDGTRFAYVEQGQGEPLVLVHGAVADHRAWERQLDTLSRHYRVIAYTQRYFGTEPWSQDGPAFGVGTHATDLAAFIEKLGVAPAHVAGWSYGASVGLALVQQHPELVRTAYLFEPAHPTWITDPGEQKALEESMAIFGPMVEAAKAGDTVAATGALLDGVDGKTGVLQTFPPEVQAVFKENAHTLARTQADPPVMSCEQLGKIPPKVTFAEGAKTEPFFRLVTETASRCMPTARHVVVPGATHLWPGIDPAGFSESVSSSIQGG